MHNPFLQSSRVRKNGESEKLGRAGKEGAIAKRGLMQGNKQAEVINFVPGEWGRWKGFERGGRGRE